MTTTRTVRQQAAAIMRRRENRGGHYQITMYHPRTGYPYPMQPVIEVFRPGETRPAEYYPDGQ